MVGFHMSGAAARTETPEPQEVHATRGRTWMMIIGTVLAFGALLSQVPSLAQLWETVKDATWWWIVLAIACTFGNRVGYACARSWVPSRSNFPSCDPWRRSSPPRSRTSRYPESAERPCRFAISSSRESISLSAVAAGAVLANVANVAVQGALFLVAVALTSYTFDLDRIDLENVVAILMLIIFLAGVLLAVVFGVRRFRERALTTMQRATATILTALRSPVSSSSSSSATCAPRSCRHSVCSRASRHTADPWVTGRSSW